MEDAEARALEWRLAGGRSEATVMGRRKEVKVCGVHIRRAHLPSAMFVTEVEVTVRWRLQPSLP